MDGRFSPGDRVLLNDDPAEVIRTYTVGETPYIRVYVDGGQAKTVCMEDVDIQHHPQNMDLPAAELADELHPGHEAVSAQWFDLQSQATELHLAHKQGQLLSISNSRVRLEPYQLECVNWVLQKLRQRALIADDVGLGKTIEAGLILKELAARNRDNRLLLVVPAHLQKKWVRDMDRFFDIELTVADRQWVEGERRRLGDTTNIWDQEDQQLITSMAFLRQDEFQPELGEAFWDVLIVDEAHKAAKRGESPSKTAKMVERVSDNSDSLLLLSATPHDGREEAFRSLIEYIDPFLVSENQELSQQAVDQVMIRRGKQSIYDDNGERVFPDRDVQSISVEMTDKEKEFYHAVTDYVQNVYNRSRLLNEPAVGFAMALMQKRLVSSVGAIRATLRRRLQSLLEEKTGIDSLSAEAEAYLDGQDLEETEKEAAEEELAGLTITESDAKLEEEIERLRNLVSMAESLPVDSKVQQVRRFIKELLEENPDEKILLFTEYRDTLDHLLEHVKDEPWADEIRVIHGDVEKEKRARIEEEFNHGTPRLLFATDAASEGIDLQHSCHIMVNYELPWNPNKLEQRIGRIHRYGQDQEVKVWNFTFEETREGEIFELLEDKIENIRSKLGNTADVLGMLDDIDLDNLIMKSVQDNEPADATREELEEMIEERQSTLQEWYDRSLIDTSTFDSKSRERIEEVIDESEAVYGTGEEIQEFFEASMRALGGELTALGDKRYKTTLPPSLTHTGEADEIGPFTFDRDRAQKNEGIQFISPDSDLLQRVIQSVLDNEKGAVGLKVLPFIKQPGITYNYKISFEDGTGETIREETIPVFVDLRHQDPQRELGRRVVDGTSINADPDTETVKEIIRGEPDLRNAAERYISSRVESIKDDLQADRHEEIEDQIQKLEEYATAEGERIHNYIEEYQQKAETGSDMDIAIRNQRERLNQLEERIKTQREELEKKSQVIAIAPEVVNICITCGS